MDTINISLPKQLTQQVDLLIKTGGFASRSEFFRNLLRNHLSNNPNRQITDNTNDLFTPFQARPLDEIRKGLESTNKYSKTFIDSVISGLSKSGEYK